MKIRAIIKIKLMAILIILLSMQSYSFSANSSGKYFGFSINSGSDMVQSSNFATSVAVGNAVISINSSNFNSDIGFVRTLPYLDGEQCSLNLECLGGFCCTNNCQSSECPAAPSAGTGAAAAGGGGGGAIAKLEDFSVDKEIVKALIKQGGAYKTHFTIKNTGTETLDFSINYSALNKFLLLSEVEFSLKPGKSKTIDAAIFASEYQKPEVYTGNIFIKAGSVSKSLPVIIEVQAKKALFDISVKILPEHKGLWKNESVAANITMVNVGDLKPVDVELYYAIKDIEGNNLTFGTETLAIYKEVVQLKQLELPPNISFGTYIFYARVSYGIETASAGDIFYVVQEKLQPCFDGIKNQNEEGTDCGGICEPCRQQSRSNKNILMLLGALVIVFLIAALLIYISKKKKGEKAEEESRSNALAKWILKALEAGHSPEAIRNALVSRNIRHRIIDTAFGRAALQKTEELEKIEKEEIGMKQLNNELIGYIRKMLDMGHSPESIRNALLKADWTHEDVHKHMSHAIKNRMRRGKL